MLRFRWLARCSRRSGRGPENCEPSHGRPAAHWGDVRRGRASGRAVGAGQAEPRRAPAIRMGYACVTSPRLRHPRRPPLGADRVELVTCDKGRGVAASRGLRGCRSHRRDGPFGVLGVAGGRRRLQRLEAEALVGGDMRVAARPRGLTRVAARPRLVIIDDRQASVAPDPVASVAFVVDEVAARHHRVSDAVQEMAPCWAPEARQRRWHDATRRSRWLAPCEALAKALRGAKFRGVD